MMGARKEGRTKGRPRCKRGRGCRLEEGQLEGVQAGRQRAIRRDANSDGFFHLRVAAGRLRAAVETAEREREREGRAAEGGMQLDK